MTPDSSTAQKKPAAASSTVKWLRLAMVGAVVLPMALFCATAEIDYTRVMSQAAERVHKTATIAQEHALKVLETSELILNRVRDLLGDDSDARIAARALALHRKLKHVESGIEQVQAIDAWNSQGNALVSSRYYPVPHINIRHREDFAAQAASDGAGTYISKVLDGPARGERFFSISRRRDLPGGRFGGVVTVSLLPQYFAQFYRALSTQNTGMTIGIYRQDGVLLARYPESRRSAARLSPGSPLMRFIASGHGVGHAHGMSEIDGTDRLFAFRKIGKYPLYVSVGMDRAAAMAEWYGNLRTSALFAFPALLALLILTWIALQKAGHEQRAIEQWREETTRRTQAEEALRQSQKLEAIGLLTGGVAHDFNNLLQVISTNLYILKLKALRGDIEPQLAAIGRAVASGEALTKHLLAFSRRRPLHPDVIDLAERMDDICTLLKHTLRGNIALQCRRQPGLWPIRVDPEELEIALLNIAVNARDALPDGGSVTIEARNAACDGSPQHANLTGHYVALSVSDTGPGIPKEIVNRVFEPFFTTKAVGKGTGLGLSQVYGFAVQSEGGATIECPPGDGTKVTLFLPRAQGMPQIKPVPLAAQPRAAAGGEILLAEDNDEIGRAIMAVLKEMGYDVRHVLNADEARAAVLAHGAYVLLITDIVMPGTMSGLELAHTMRTRLPEMPVLLISGYGAEAERAAAAGYRILSKPFRPETLAEAIRHMLQDRPRTAAHGALEQPV